MTDAIQRALNATFSIPRSDPRFEVLAIEALCLLWPAIVALDVHARNLRRRRGEIEENVLQRHPYRALVLAALAAKGVDDPSAAELGLARNRIVQRQPKPRRGPGRRPTRRTSKRSLGLVREYLRTTGSIIAALADIAAQNFTWVDRPASQLLLDLEGAGLLTLQRVNRARTMAWRSGFRRGPRRRSALAAEVLGLAEVCI